MNDCLNQKSFIFITTDLQEQKINTSNEHKKIDI